MTDKVLAFSLFEEEDIARFREGNHHHIHRLLGAHPTEVEGQRGVYFAVYAPAARVVQVIGNFNAWQGEGYELKVRWDQSGIWEGFIPGVESGELYKFRLSSHHQEGWLEKADPYARRAEHPPKTASIVHRADYAWGDEHWMSTRGERNSLHAPISTYEMHFGSWKKRQGKPLGYREMAAELIPYLQKAGFTHVEFLPLMEYPYEPSWGYQITGYFAPSSRFGGPEDLKYLIDQLHQAGIGVIFDWVPAHFPADAHGLGRFDGSHLYEHPDRRRGYHPDWKSLIFNYGRPEVRSFLISNALYWLEEFHLDGLRVDAVASMLYLDYSRESGQWEPNQYGGNENLEAIDFIKKCNEAIYHRFPDVQTIAEESTSYRGVSRPTYTGGLGFGMKWMMGWMNDNLEYFKRDPLYRSFHHGEITFSLTYAFSENFMLPLSHDEVVHGKGSLLSRMPGDDWQQFANLRLLYSWQFLHPGTKLLFMGQEFGQRSEWNFAEELPWWEAETEAHHGIFQCLQSLNQLYRREKALHRDQFSGESFEWISYDDRKNCVLSFRRHSHQGTSLHCLLNLSPIPHSGYRIGVKEAGTYQLLFNSDERAYWGSGHAVHSRVDSQTEPMHGCENSLSLRLPPLGALVYQRA